jgi:hypothetical protein
MNFKNICFVFLMSLCFLQTVDAQSQDRRWALTASNNITGMPVVSYHKIFYSQFHPGLDAQMSWQLNKSEVNRIYVHANAGFYYHQFVQTLVRLYPSINYERQLGRFAANIGLGGGYGLSFEGKNAFILQADGTYANKSFAGARSQFLVTFEIGGRYALQADNPFGPQIIAKFASFMQGTYVNSYVPLLPLNSFQIGFSMPLTKETAE